MFERAYYKGLPTTEIVEKIREEGFDPLRISDPPGAVYAPHSHPETKLLAFLEGTMRVTVQGQAYSCAVGDRLLIPGNVEHSALVGPEGCMYFWSEKLV